MSTFRVAGRGIAAFAGLVCLTGYEHEALADDAGTSAASDFFSSWFATSDAAKESQPHWMTPLVTVTPRLEQEFRYDQAYQNRTGDVVADGFGNGKGLEVIPLPDTEVIIGVPNYQVIQRPHRTAEVGATDETLLVKYRALSANEENGNYILTGFMGVSLPTGSENFTNHKAIFTPTLAGGYGWGTREQGFDIQSTVGVAIPAANEGVIGTTTTWNTSFQGHVSVFWPEFETQFTSYHDGEHAGHTQWAMTAGLIAGRFDLGPRARLIVGAGYQWPVTNFHTFNNTWTGTVRVAF